MPAWYIGKSPVAKQPCENRGIVGLWISTQFDHVDWWTRMSAIRDYSAVRTKAQMQYKLHTQG